MRTKIALITSLAALGAVIPTAAWAQDAAPAAAAPAAPPAPAAPEAAPTPAEGAPAAAATPATPAPAGPTPWPGWVRIDHDGGALQLWGGATAPLVDGLGLAFDMYVNSGFLGEFDIGPAIAVSTLTLTPMIGLQFDWSDRKLAAVVPQLYLTGPIGDKLYNELWVQYYNYKLSKYQDEGNGTFTYLYLREFLDYKISDYVGVGPQIELTQNFTQSQLQSLPIGANVMLNAGLNSTLFFFLGYETNKNSNTYATGDDGMGNATGTEKHNVAGRLTFVHNF
ncbi:MAG TPA: hypothetical protein VHB79_24635 [Polyangiaceae bacterium]|nr:hypothetical protein [Polyangiaceae bacterium]